MTSEPSTDRIRPRSPVLKTPIERGYVHQAANLAGLDGAFESGLVPAYVGFDATAEELAAVDLAQGVALVDLLMLAGLPTSKSEARRAIAGRGVRLNGEIVGDRDHTLEARSAPSRPSLGRKRHVAIRIEQKIESDDVGDHQ